MAYYKCRQRVGANNTTVPRGQSEIRSCNCRIERSVRCVAFRTDCNSILFSLMSWQLLFIQFFLKKKECAIKETTSEHASQSLSLSLISLFLSGYNR